MTFSFPKYPYKIILRLNSMLYKLYIIDKSPAAAIFPFLPNRQKVTDAGGERVSFIFKHKTLRSSILIAIAGRRSGRR